MKEDTKEQKKRYVRPAVQSASTYERLALACTGTSSNCNPFATSWQPTVGGKNGCFTGPQCSDAAGFS